VTTLAERRCFHHADREAVARCPACRRFFCRECITEHEGRVVCASCLTGEDEAESEGRRRPVLLRWAFAVASFALLWGCFLFAGRALLALPDSFHDGTLWRPELGETLNDESGGAP